MSIFDDDWFDPWGYVLAVVVGFVLIGAILLYLQGC
jgi:hypothetical protein